MLHYLVDAIGSCPGGANCGTALLVAATIVLAVASLGQTIVLTFTWLSIRSSNRETSLLRQEAVRLAALPILEVLLHRTSDGVIFRNASTTSAASRTLLQGFRFSWDRDENRETWKCSFEPTGLIAPGQQVGLDVNIDQELVDSAHSRSVPGNQILTTAFNRAIEMERPHMILSLFFEDMLGNCYQSEVNIDWVQELEFFLIAAGDTAGPRSDVWPAISRAFLVEGFPESLQPLDRTIHEGGVLEHGSG